MSVSVQQCALNASNERASGGFSGYLALLLMLVALAYGIWSLTGVITNGENTGTADFIGLIGTIAVFTLLSASFCMIQPNQGVAIALFGAYKGTQRNEGLRWVWPWMGKAKISLRSNNLISNKIKVNDLRGHPIEIAAQVVWRWHCSRKKAWLNSMTSARRPWYRT